MFSSTTFQQQQSVAPCATTHSPPDSSRCTKAMAVSTRHNSSWTTMILITMRWRWLCVPTAGRVSELALPNEVFLAVNVTVTWDS